MLTVLLPENDRSPALRDLLVPLLPPGSVIRDPDEGLDGLNGPCYHHLRWHCR